MSARQSPEEAREQQLIIETRAQFSALSRAVLTGDPAATKRIADALCEYVADTHTAGEFVRAVLLNSQAALTAITDLIWTEAGELAEAEVARQECARIESEQDSLIEVATWLRRFA